jgi:23S rRNA (guanosine2251-2'-O)-methyltransferase
VTESKYEVRECTAGSCRFRFPVVVGSEDQLPCPRCGAATTSAAEYAPSGQEAGTSLRVPGPTVVALLDNIRSAYNVGAIFRTADGAGLDHLYLCGMTPTPEHRKVAKTALGAQDIVSWSYRTNGRLAGLALKEAGFCLWAVENIPGATWLFEASRCREASLALVVGNEKAGVDPGLLAACDQVLKLPMLGGKESLNVEVAFGIVAYWVRFGLGSALRQPGR